MEEPSTAARSSERPVDTSSTPSNTSQDKFSKTSTHSNAQTSNQKLNNVASEASYTPNQQAVNAPSNTVQNTSSKTSTYSNPQTSKPKLNNAQSGTSHAPSVHSTTSQQPHKHRHARDCQSSMAMNELQKEISRSRTERAQGVEPSEPKPKLLRPKKDTVIPMTIPSSSVAPETVIMRRPNAWMRRMFAHPHRRVSPTSGRVVDRPVKAVSSVNEVARYVEYNKVQDPMLNHAAYIEAHRARIHQIVQHRRAVVDTGPPQTMGKYISKWKVKQRWKDINIMRDNFWLFETLLRTKTEYDHMADQRWHIEHKIAMEKRLRDAKIFLRTYKGYRNVKVGRRRPPAVNVIKYNGLQGPDVRTAADPRY